MPPESGHWRPRGPGADLPRTGATPPAHPPEPHSKPASRPPGLSVIPPFPAGYAQYLTFRPHIPRVPAARVKGRLEREVDRTPNFALDRDRARISVASPRNRGFSRAECEPQCASQFQARTRIRVRRPGHALWGMLLGSTPGSASRPELADH